MKMLKRPLLLICLLTVFAGLSITAIAARAAEHSERVLAVVGNHKITESEVDAKAKPQLMAIRNQIYEAKKQALDHLIDSYLVEQAAKKAGLSEAAYLKREVQDKVPQVTDKEVDAFYQQHSNQIHQPLAKIRAPLTNYLQRLKLQQAEQQLVADLRQQNQVKVMLEAPQVKVSTADSAGTLGPANAPVKMVEFADFQCPFCERSEGPIKEVLKKYGKRIHFVYMDFPLSIHHNALRAALAARCAADQGKFWQYHDALFADQSALDAKGLKATAARLGLKTKAFDQCLDAAKHLPQIQKSEREGAEIGVNGTPTFVINGVMMTGAQSAGQLEEAIDAQLAAHDHADGRKRASAD